MLIGLSNDMPLLCGAWEQFVPVTLCPDLSRHNVLPQQSSLLFFFLSVTLALSSSLHLFCTRKQQAGGVHARQGFLYSLSTYRIMLFAAHRITLTEEENHKSTTLQLDFSLLSSLACIVLVILVLVSVQVSPVHSMAMEVLHMRLVVRRVAQVVVG